MSGEGDSVIRTSSQDTPQVVRRVSHETYDEGGTHRQGAKTKRAVSIGGVFSFSLVRGGWGVGALLLWSD